MGYVWDVGSSGCGMFGIWDVPGCGMFGMWNFWDVGCKMWDVCWDMECCYTKCQIEMEV